LKLKVGSKVRWKWLGREIDGVIKEIHLSSVTRTIKGKSIKRNGTDLNPAYVVESVAGNAALKLQSELVTVPRTESKTRRPKPTLFDGRSE
jgi:hypothetical protein